MSVARIGLSSNGARSADVSATTEEYPRRVDAAISRSGHWTAVYLASMILGAAALTALMANAISEFSLASGVLLICFAISALWIVGGAASAVIGLLAPAEPSVTMPKTWRPHQQTALLMLLCGEPAQPVADYLRSLKGRLKSVGLADSVSLFVLSDTQDDAQAVAEERALADLVAARAIHYRRRRSNAGRKPGNIAEWLHTRGNQFAYMAVLDADSRMTADRIRDLIYRMEHAPGLGLLQAGIGMVLGRSRFGRHLRLTNRLLSPNFARGMAAWSSDAGNYWGHNAIMRVAAFSSAVELPVLSGRAPFGGLPLSHDFVEAAWIRRAGWSVVLDPDTCGSAEDGPQTLAEFHRRDRRWCQGNLQHLRLLATPGLHPMSRLHLASGIASYLVAPLWLVQVALIASGEVAITGALPLVLVGFALMAPKFCALIYWFKRVRSLKRRILVLRASASELLVSTLIAPLVMVRQCGAVLSVLMGRDCGWKSSGLQRFVAPAGSAEVIIGMGLLALALSNEAWRSALLLLPLVLPLLLAPVLSRWLDR